LNPSACREGSVDSLENALLGRLVSALCATATSAVPELEFGDLQGAVDRDFDLLESALRIREPAEIVRIWTNRRCIVTPRRQLALPAFSEAAQAMAVAGWPVVLRRSGGTAIVHRPGVLNISLIRIEAEDAQGIQAHYRTFLWLLTRACAEIDIDCDTGRAPGAYCDGEYNLLVHGRKVGGTAMFRRRAGASVATLVHASIVVHGRPARDLAAISRFEQMLGIRGCYDASRLSSLAEHVAH
jgi:lipoate-protein ligase A